MSISTFAPVAMLLAAATSKPVLETLVPATAPATQPTAAMEAIGLVALLMAVAAVILIPALGLWRPRAVIGPERLPPRGKTSAVLISLGVGLFVWFGTQVFYSAFLVASLERQGVTDAQKHLHESLTSKDLAILSTVPQVAAFAAMALLLAFAGGSLLRRLGLGLRRLPFALGAGVLAFIVMYPAIILGSVAVENVYRQTGYTHPAEHDLLKGLGQATDPRLMMLIILGATACAPIFEEFLFRAHIQTLLRHGLGKLSRARQPVVAPAMVEVPPWLAPQPQPPGMPPTVVGYASAAVEEEQPRHTAAWPSWVAILLTSVIFAMVHPTWMQPLIFLLSIGLGYVYERTGSLWSSITLHVLFNAVNTLQYYFLIHPR